MKIVIIACLTVLMMASTTIATEKEKPNFDNIKRKELDTISVQIQSLTKKQGCVSNATNWKDMQKCNQEFHGAMKQQRIIQIEEQQKALEQRKQQLQQQQQKQQ